MLNKNGFQMGLGRTSGDTVGTNTSWAANERVRQFVL